MNYQYIYSDEKYGIIDVHIMIESDDDTEE